MRVISTLVEQPTKEGWRQWLEIQPCDSGTWDLGLEERKAVKEAGRTWSEVEETQ